MKNTLRHIVYKNFDKITSDIFKYKVFMFIDFFFFLDTKIYN